MSLLTPDVEPLWIARYDYEPLWHLPLHAHDDYFQLILIVSGAGEALIAEERRPFQAGHMLFLRPGLAHGLQAGPDGPVRTLDTKFLLRRAKLHAACRSLESFHTKADERVIAILEAIHAKARQTGQFSNALCQTLLTQLLLHLLQRKPLRAISELPTQENPGISDDDLAQRMENYLRENCAERIDQKILSAALRYSYRHLHSTWLKRHHESPLQALWHYRVARATELIRYSDYELKRIAELTGFTTVHHFTRVFTRITGTPPARWREREREGVRQDIVIRPGFINPALTIQGPPRHT